MRISAVERRRLNAMSIFEYQLQAKGFQRIAGIDEAGRGPLAGPVVAAACIFSKNVFFEHLNDSKQLTPQARQILYQQITTSPHVMFGVGIVDVETIDAINILQATLLAMQKAVHALSVAPDYLLIDGNRCPAFDIPSEAIVKGDSRSVSIAAASVIAKVTRDQMLEKWDAEWPAYGFKNHKGYGTQQHCEAILKWGPCPLHRKSFEPIKSILKSFL